MSFVNKVKGKFCMREKKSGKTKRYSSVNQLHTAHSTPYAQLLTYTSISLIQNYIHNHNLISNFAKLFTRQAN